MTGPTPLHAQLGLPATAVLVVAGGVLGWWYATGLRQALAGPRARLHTWRAAALATGIACTVLATAPPLGELLEQRLSTHMVQHLVLIMVAAPLLALAAPGRVLVAGLPRSLRRRVTGALRRAPALGLLAPHLAWGLHIAALWLWHLPAAYDLAVRSGVAHVLEHATFLSTAWLFWWHLTRAGRHRLRGARAAFYVLAAVPPGAALGAVLTFPDHPIYPDQAARAAAAGTDPLFDQHLGGLIMWVPLDFVYLGLGIWILGHWLRRLEGAADPVRLPADARVHPGMEVAR